MVKFFAGLTGVGVILSNPMLVIGAFALACVGLGVVGGVIGADAGLTALFGYLGLILVWIAPFAAVIASLAETERNARIHTSAAANYRKNRVWNAIGAGLIGLYVPSLLLLLVAGFVSTSACERGDPNALLVFQANPLFVTLRFFGLDLGPGFC